MHSRNSVGTYQGNEPKLNSSGNTRLQSCQLAEPLKTAPGLESGIYCAGVDLQSKKKKKKAQAGNESSNFSPKSSQARKKPSPLLHYSAHYGSIVVGTPYSVIQPLQTLPTYIRPPDHEELRKVNICPKTPLAVSMEKYKACCMSLLQCNR